MQRAALRIGDHVGYTIDHSKSDYRSVDYEAYVVAFREGREGIGLAVKICGDWQPRWVSGHHVMMFWEEHLKKEEQSKRWRQERHAKAKAHQKHLDGIKKRFADLGIKVEVDNGKGSSNYSLKVGVDTLNNLLARLERTHQEDERDWL